MGKVKVVKHKGGKELNKLLKNGLRGSVKAIEVGFFESSRYQDGTQVAYVAAIQEFGTDEAGKNKNIVIPERPFFRNATKTVTEKLSKIVKNRIDPKTMIIDESLADTLGEVYSGEIKKSIVSLRDPANADSTKARKKSTNPLIGLTSTLLQAATHKVSK